MSTTLATIERITSVEPHPNADRLDIVKVLGFQVVTQKGTFKVGDDVVYFPPDLLLPEVEADKLGVTNYLKHATFPGETEKRPCRVGAARLRGVPSYGFVAPLKVWSGGYPLTYLLGRDVTSDFGAEKYVPPVRVGGGESADDFAPFHRYTNIESIQRYPDLIPEGTDVIITEKIHGTNCRMGLCRYLDEMVFMAGSHKIRRKSGEGLYWSFFTDNIRDMLTNVSGVNDEADVIIFGEIFGPGVQDMQYGQTEKVFRAFDISLNGKYVSYERFLTMCHTWDILTVPELYIGPFSHAVCEEYTYGDTTFSGVKGFKGREGIVIKPMIEQVNYLGQRVIAKSVSADYMSRKGAEDNE